MLDTLIVVSLVLIVVSKFTGVRTLKAEPSGIVITAREYGSRWPFTDEKLRIVCQRPDQVHLQQDETSRWFALTKAALNPLAWPSYHALLQPGANDQIIPELIQRGLKLCPANTYIGPWLSSA